mmetsp:Transcript_24495/g.59433  ORF Transcript_24495/g.59433 Transcript_24495/m.59433 type:complete len:223 (+) Transcript_24495:2647-3315(+)
MKITGGRPRREVATHKRLFWPPLRALHCEYRLSPMPRACNTSIESLPCSTPRKPANSCKCSSTVISGNSGLSWGQKPKRCLTAVILLSTEKPATVAFPAVILTLPVRHWTAVVLPAPLWPNSAKISPFETSSDNPSTALKVSFFPRLKVFTMLEMDNTISVSEPTSGEDFEILWNNLSPPRVLISHRNAMNSQNSVCKGNSKKSQPAAGTAIPRSASPSEIL